MIAEALSPSFGVLGFGGLVAFILGSVMLMDTTLLAYQIAFPIILSLAAISALLLIVTFKLALKARKQVVVSGVQTMVGTTAEAMESFEFSGSVRVQGEIWQATSQHPVEKGDLIQIKTVNGLMLEVEAQQ